MAYTNFWVYTLIRWESLRHIGKCYITLWKRAYGLGSGLEQLDRFFVLDLANIKLQQNFTTQSFLGGSVLIRKTTDL